MAWNKRLTAPVIYSISFFQYHFFVQLALQRDSSACFILQAAAAFVNNITFSLIKTGVYNTTTTMKVGSKVHFQMQITFPVGTTDLDVELFTPDNSTTVMIICSPQITWVGKNMNFSNYNLVPVLSASDNSYNVSQRLVMRSVWRGIRNSSWNFNFYARCLPCMQQHFVIITSSFSCID